MYKFLMSFYMGGLVILLTSAIVVDSNVLSCIGGISAAYTYLTN